MKSFFLSKYYILLCAFIGMFPWVSFGLNRFDTQPWFFVCALPVFIHSIAKPLFMEGILYFFCALVLIFFIAYDFHQNPIDVSRSIVLYISMCQAIIVYNRFYRESQEFRLKLIVVVNLLWLLYAVLQYCNLDVYIPLVFSRTSESRGLTSLAPEPTFYAIFSTLELFILLFERRIAKKENKSTRTIDLLFLLNVIEIFFVAKSAMGIALIAVVSAWYLVMKRPILFFAMVLVSAILPFSHLESFLSRAELDTRAMQVLSGLVSDPSLLLVNDQSINQRIASVYISISASINDLFMPHGVLRFSKESQVYYHDLDWFTDRFDNNKILSYYGSIIFETGFLSLLYFTYLWVTIRKVNSFRDSIAVCGGVTIVLLTAVPLGLPLVGMTIAAASVKWKRTPVLH